MTSAPAPSPEIELEFGDGTYLFSLNLPYMHELQRCCGTEQKPDGLGAIMARVLAGRYSIDDGQVIGLIEEAAWRVNDIVDTIRLGLISGGQGVVAGAEVKVSSTRARELVATYVLARPLAESWALAATILGTRVQGYLPPAVEADPPKKEKAPRRTKASSTTSAP